MLLTTLTLFSGDADHMLSIRPVSKPAPTPNTLQRADEDEGVPVGVPDAPHEFVDETDGVSKVDGVRTPVRLKNGGPIGDKLGVLVTVGVEAKLGAAVV